MNPVSSTKLSPKETAASLAQQELLAVSQKLQNSLIEFESVMDDLSVKVCDTAQMIHTVRKITEIPQVGMDLMSTFADQAIDEVRAHPKRYALAAACAGIIAFSAIYLARKEN